MRMGWKWARRPCDAGCWRRGCGAACRDGKPTGSVGSGGSTLPTWCSWMAVSMPGLRSGATQVSENMVDDATGTTSCQMGEQETIWTAVGVLRGWKVWRTPSVVHRLEECL